MSVPVDVLASSLSIRVPSLVDTQVKCSGSTSSRPVSAVKLPSAAVQLLALPVPVAERGEGGSLEWACPGTETLRRGKVTDSFHNNRSCHLEEGLGRY